MSVITEIARIPLQYVDIESSSTEAGKTFNELLDLLRNAKGSRRVLWSRQNERADVLEILIGTSYWEDYAAFEAFPTTAEFQKFLELLPTIAAGAPSIKNARFRTTDGLADIASGPVLEMTTTYLPLDVDQAAYEAIVDSFLLVLAKNTSGLLGSASGWVIEEQDNPKPDAESTKFKAFVVVLAWESIDAHTASTRIAANKEAIQPWKAAVSHVEMVDSPQ